MKKTLLIIGTCLGFQIGVLAQIPANVFWSDSFENGTNPTTGTRTPSVENSSGGATATSYFRRAQGDISTFNSIPFTADLFTQYQVGFRYWAVENIDNALNGNESGQSPFQTVTWSGINVAGKRGITLGGYFGASGTATQSNNFFETSDMMRIDYKFDNGGWQTALNFGGTFDGTCRETESSRRLYSQLAHFEKKVSGAQNYTTMSIKITCYSDDFNEEMAFDFFHLYENPLSSHVEVLYNGSEVYNSIQAGYVPDHAQFGSNTVCAGDITKTYTLKNAGESDLLFTQNPYVTIEGGNAADFVVTTQPSSPVNGLVNTSFIVAFRPKTPGTKESNVVIRSNANNSLYSYRINGFASGTAPLITSTTPGSTCPSNSVSLQATSNIGTLNWYSTASGGTPLTSGTTFITPNLANTTSYYVEAVDGTCTTPRSTVTATVIQLPEITSVTPAENCGSGSMNLGATATDGIISWYDAASAGNLLGTGNNYNTPILSSTTSYWVEAANNCGNSARSQVIATIKAIPAITGVSSASRCESGSLVLGAIANFGTINWYDAPSGGALLATGVSFNTPSISANTNYYVESTSNGCISSRSVVQALVFDCSQLSVSSCGVVIASMNDILTSDVSSGASDYRYEISHSIAGLIAVYTKGAANNQFSLSSIPGLKYGTTYFIKVAVKIGTDWSPYGSSCNVTTPATQLNATSCGAILVNLTDDLYSYSVEGATDYRYEVKHAATTFTSIYTRGAADNLFRMSLVSGVTGSKIYTVRVAALVAGIWQAYGMSCNVQTPVPLTQLASGSCNVTIPKMATNLACNAVSGATNYRYEVINTALGYNQVYVKGSNSTLFRINYLSGILFNTTYTVRVAAMVNGLWGAYGPACTVKTPVSLMIQDDGNLENAASKFANEYILDIFPNPSRDRFTFRSEQAGEFVLINELGQKLHVFSLNKENAFQFELSELSPGNYFVLSTNGTEMQAKKLTIIP